MALSDSLDRKRIVITELLATGFVAAIAGAANASHLRLLLFPELAAVAHDVFTRPRGTWACQPLRLIATPVLAGMVGLIVSRYFHYGAFPVLLITLLSLVVIRLLKSSIGPAFSAGLLPLAIEERGWLYPVAILIGLTGLVLALLVWQRLYLAGKPALKQDTGRSFEDALEARVEDRTGLLHMLAFVFVAALMAQFRGLHLILFPPLVVMAYEVFGHPELPGWVKRPALFPLFCFLTAAVGLISLQLLGNTSLSVALTVALSILLRIFKVRMPPALAVGLLPFIMRNPSWCYPASVFFGAAMLSLWFLTRSRLRRGSRATFDLR